MRGQRAGPADSPNEEREVLLVEQGDVGRAMVNEDLDLVAEDVDEADEDEGIGDEGRPGQLLDVADQGEGCGRAVALASAGRPRSRGKHATLTQEDDELGHDQVGNRDVSVAVGHGHEERLQVLRLSRRSLPRVSARSREGQAKAGERGRTTKMV